jgi:hypothetical protein
MRSKTNSFPSGIFANIASKRLRPNLAHELHFIFPSSKSEDVMRRKWANAQASWDCLGPDPFCIPSHPVRPSYPPFQVLRQTVVALASPDRIINRKSKWLTKN